MTDKLVTIVEHGCPECHSNLTRETEVYEPAEDQFGVHHDKCNNPICGYNRTYSDNPHLQLVAA